jgi:hypothetical protein
MMAFSNGSQILDQIIENLVDSDVSYDDRKIVYEILLEVFEDFDAKNLEECLDMDKAWDEVWNEKYPPEVEDYEDEE